MDILLIFIGLISLLFIAWLVGVIRETHEKTLGIEEKLANIETLLEKNSDNK